ncbi:MAG TPA: 50S ribosomal protein L3 N(5)-glutamine methyltransferase, partial [Burkholderiaceae bacterium]|nr:50S ribosomal protein L3 N(5)-glutamine methyltransferase [Burkholderiaceae bacterium]
PYVNAASMAALPPEFRCEPAIALAGGDDGMDFVRRLIREAATHLQPTGILVLEIGHERAHFDAAFPRLDVVALPTSEGDDAVLLIARDALERA